MMVKNKQEESPMIEKSLLRSLCYPLILKNYGTAQDGRNLYLLMEFCIGGELFTLLKLNRRFPRKIATFYVAEILLVLEYLYDNKIIYRDLKPENVMLDAYGHVKLVDFGVSKKLTPDKNGNYRTSTLTGT